VLETHLPEAGDERARLVVEPLERGVLDLPPAGELFDQQPAIRTQEHVGRAELPCAFETADRRRVLGPGVGRDADPVGDRGDDRAVAVDRQAKTTFRRQYSHLYTPSVRFRRSSSTADIYSGQA
jgi:hypothetical protein